MRFNGKIKHYRPSRYRPHKRPIDRRVLIVAGAACAMLVFSIILGAWLNSRVDASLDTDTAETDVQTAPERAPFDAYPAIKTEPVYAQILARSAYSSDTNLDKAIEKATENGVKAFCFELTNTDGIPRFTSSTYSEVLSASSGKSDLARFVTKADMRGIEVRAQLELRSQKEENADTRDLRLALEVALIAEAYRAGVREVLLSGIDEMSTADRYSLVRRIREACPELAVGIAARLTPEQSQDIMLMADLCDIFDFVAIDLSDALALDCADKKEDGTALSEAAQKYVYALTRYSARVFLRAGDGCSHCTDTATSKLRAAGVSGVYFITSDKLHA